MLADAVDAAILAAAARAWRARSVRAPARHRSWGLQGRAADFLAVQLRSPGERLLGIRTVDRRTGRRVALWRTLLLSGSRLGGFLLLRRLVAESPEDERQREWFTDEMQAILERHPRASPARDAEREALAQRYPGRGLLRTIGPWIAFGLLNAVLRRLLEPTVRIRARGAADHTRWERASASSMCRQRRAVHDRHRRRMISRR
jgi:hypothetical protein